MDREEAVLGGRRERHKKATWDKLYAAAIELFTERGYDQTSIEAITERADVARGTFFNYFDRKEDVIFAWGAKRRDMLREELAKACEQGLDVVTSLENCMRALAKINVLEWDTTRVMLLAWVRCGRPITEEPFSSSLFAEIVGTGIAKGEVVESVDPTVAGNMLRDSYLGILYRYVGTEKDPGTLCEELLLTLRTLLLGLLPVSSTARAAS